MLYFRKKLKQYESRSWKKYHSNSTDSIRSKTYELNFSLRCQLEEDNGCISITSEMLDIIGTGKTENEAYQSFCQEFDFIYNRYNDLNDNQLTDRLLNIKKMINLTEKTYSDGSLP